MVTGFRIVRLRNNKVTNFSCDCMPEHFTEEESMPVVKGFNNEQVDLRQVFKDPGVRLADFHAKLYDLGTGCTITTTEKGCISITVFAKPKNIKAYINTPEEAVSTLEEVMALVLQRS